MHRETVKQIYSSVRGFLKPLKIVSFVCFVYFVVKFFLCCFVVAVKLRNIVVLLLANLIFTGILVDIEDVPGS